MDNHHVGLTITSWILLTLSVAIICSPVYLNTYFLTHPKFEPLCTEHTERYIESDGKESSLILEFNAGEAKANLCMNILSASESHGFIVRLIRPKLRKSFHNAHSGPPHKYINDLNTTRTCPLKVFSSLDPLIPSWVVDPCYLEDSSVYVEDPVKLFQGRLRIVWEHHGYTLSSKLMVTVVGKGNACQDQNKHPCLKIGLDPLLCISKDLVCDGIRHCPYSNDYDNDEDYTMCWKRKKIDDSIQGDMWEHWAIEALRNLFAFDVPIPELPRYNATESNEIDLNKKNRTLSNSTGAGSGYTRRNSTRIGINSDLSKYGPWGYLMLGMLLCGGALLICGLWASASQSAHNDPESSAQQANNNNSIENHSTPPNYEELDPPPSYSVLFPNQKAVTPVGSIVASPSGTSSQPNTSSVGPAAAVSSTS